MKQWHLILLSIAAGAAGVFVYRQFIKKPCKCKEKSTEKSTVVTGANLQNNEVKLNYAGKTRSAIL